MKIRHRSYKNLISTFVEQWHSETNSSHFSFKIWRSPMMTSIILSIYQLMITQYNQCAKKKYQKKRDATKFLDRIEKQAVTPISIHTTPMWSYSRWGMLLHSFTPGGFHWWRWDFSYCCLFIIIMMEENWKGFIDILYICFKKNNTKMIVIYQFCWCK